jgi:hypothetical protein
VLSAWRAAERELGMASDPAEVARLESRVDALRSAYREAAIEASDGFDTPARDADGTAEGL